MGARKLDGTISFSSFPTLFSYNFLAGSPLDLFDCNKNYWRWNKCWWVGWLVGWSGVTGRGAAGGGGMWVWNKWKELKSCMIYSEILSLLSFLVNLFERKSCLKRKWITASHFLSLEKERERERRVRAFFVSHTTCSSSPHPWEEDDLIYNPKLNWIPFCWCICIVWPCLFFPFWERVRHPPGSQERERESNACFCALTPALLHQSALNAIIFWFIYFYSQLSPMIEENDELVRSRIGGWWWGRDGSIRGGGKIAIPSEPPFSLAFASLSSCLLQAFTPTLIYSQDLL